MSKSFHRATKKSYNWFYRLNRTTNDKKIKLSLKSFKLPFVSICAAHRNVLALKLSDHRKMRGVDDEARWLARNVEPTARVFNVKKVAFLL